MDEETTQVVFRCWRDAKTVIALFPGIPTDLYGHFCEAYEHVGQHGGADYYGVIRATTPGYPYRVHFPTPVLWNVRP